MKLHYVSGSRADFGLMAISLQRLGGTDGIDLGLVLTGQATNPHYGDVAGEAVRAGLRIVHVIPAQLTGAGRSEMAAAFADQCAGFAALWSADAPDLVLLLGDRAEMLAAATIAYHLGIPTAHLHGGERSGTLDDGFRHAISKLASFHFVASDDSRERLLAMGEHETRITVTGAPGLVGLAETAPFPRTELLERLGLGPAQKLAVMLFHPVVEEAGDAYAQTACLIGALDAAGIATLVLAPNSDAGASDIARAISDCANPARFAIGTHVERADYLRLLATADFLIGNSSSGIIESASVGTMCINLGSRQNGRLRNANTFDCPNITARGIAAGIAWADGARGTGAFTNQYGDGRADEHLLAAITALDLSPGVTAKTMRY